MAEAAVQPILVTNIPADVTEIFFRALFENERKTGGGKIKDVQLHQGQAIIIYEDHEVAKRVLEKEFVLFKGTRLRIAAFNTEHCRKTVIVHVSTPKTIDEVEVVYEAEEISSGGPTDSVECQGDNKFLVRFEKEEDAAEVLRTGKIEYDGCVYIATPPPLNSLLQVWNRRTVQVQSSKGNLDKDTIEVICDNKEITGGGPVEYVTVHTGAQQATVVFEREEDAAAVLKRKTVSFENWDLTFTIPSAKASTQAAEPEMCLLIQNLPENFSEKIFVLFFENNGKSGGGPIKTKDFRAEKQMALIQFNNNCVTSSVIKRHKERPLQFNGRELQIEILEHWDAIAKMDACERDLKLSGVSPAKKMKQDGQSTLKLDVGTCAVEVSNFKCCILVGSTSQPNNKVTLMLGATDIPDGVSENHLKITIEVTTKIKIEKMVYLPDENRAIMTFTSSSAADNVVQKYLDGKLKIEKQTLVASLLHPICGEIEESEDYDPAMICITNLAENPKASEIKNYLEHNIQTCKVKEIVFGEKSDSALVIMSKSPGYPLLHQLACQKPLMTTMIGIEGVEKYRSVVVSNAGELSEEKLQMYFEHSESNGGETECVNFFLEEDYAIIRFKSHKDAEKVCRKCDHNFENKPLQVLPYFSCIGLRQDKNESDETKKVTELTVAVKDSRIISFLTARLNLKNSIEQEMKSLGADVIWESSSMNAEVILKKRPGLKRLEDARVTLDHLLQQWDIEVVQGPEKGWGEYVEAINSLFINRDELVLHIQRNTCTIELIGYCDAIRKIIATLEKKKEEIIKKYQTETDIVNLDEHKVKLLGIMKFPESLQPVFHDFVVKLDIDRKEVHFTGSAENIKSAKLEMFKVISSGCTRQIPTSPHLHKLLSEDNVRRYIQSRLEFHQVVWDIDNPQYIILHGKDDNALRKAENVIMGSIFEKNIPDVGDDVLQSAEWIKFSRNLVSTYRGKLVLEYSQENENRLCIVGCEDIQQEIMSRVTKYLQDNSVVHEFVAMNEEIVEYIRLYMKDRLTSDIFFGQDPSKSGFLIECNKDHIQKAKKLLRDLQTQIKCQKHSVKFPVSSAVFDQNTKTFFSGIQNERKVLIQQDNGHGGQFKQGGSKIKTKATYPNGKMLYIMQGDVTECQVDAIVNAADPVLDHGGGVAKAIVDKGGYSIQVECTNHMKSRSKMVPGDIFVSNAGTLKCKKIIHTVGPKWNKGRGEPETELFVAVEAPLQEASANGWTSVALPAISTGKYGFPIHEACKIIIPAIGSFLEGSSSVTEVYVVDNNTDVVDACHNSLCQHVSPDVTVENLDKISLGASAAAATSLPMRQSTKNSNWSQGNSDQVITKNGITVTLVIGSITDEKTQVVTNLTSNDLNLSNGVVSKLISSAAGDQIQQECKKNYRNGIRNGEIAVTSGGYSFHWRKIFHGSCSDYSSGSADQEMRRFLNNCLVTADQDGFSSISFPSVGTGSLRFPVDAVTRIMFDEVKVFSEQYPKTTVKDVHFVVYHEDRYIIKEFQGYMSKLLTQPSVSSPSTISQPHKGSFYWKPGSTIGSLVSLENLEVSLEKKSIHLAETEVVVNLTASSLNLSHGAVSQFILKSAGPKIQEECEQKYKRGIQNGDIAVTSGGKNPYWKNIYHGSCSAYSVGSAKSEMKNVIQKCLKQADRDRIRTMAFPSMGTGSLQFPPTEIMRMMYDELKSFSQKYQNSSLKSVTIVIFDEPIYQEFLRFSKTLQNIPTATPVSGKPKTSSNEWHIIGTNKIQTRQGITITLSHGELAKQKADVLVNLTSKDLNLSKGAVSKSLLNAAGNSIQDQCKGKTVKCGDVFQTHAGKISGCKRIFHGACSSVYSSESKKEMESFVEKSLYEAHQDNMRSIAFPSIGTGTLGFTGKEVAKMMYRQVKRFSVIYPQSKLCDVYMVVYDQKIFQDFQTELGNLPKGTRMLVMNHLKDFYKTITGKQEQRSGIPKRTKTQPQETEMEYLIYGTNKLDIAEAKKDIDSVCERQFVVTVMESARDQEAIRKLDLDEIEMIKSLGIEFGVTINVEQESPKPKITVKGLQTPVLSSVHEIHNVFRGRVEREKAEDEMHLLTSQAQWQYETDDGSLEFYPEGINAIIAKADHEKKPIVQWEEYDTSLTVELVYRINFQDKEEICVNDPSKRRRVRRYHQGAEKQMLPDTWDEMMESERLKVIKLQKGSREYNEVEQSFVTSVKQVKDVAVPRIQEIERIQNQPLYKSYFSHKEHMQSANSFSQQPHERILWHATTKETVPKINYNGFNRSFCGKKHGAKLGNGVYFATHAGYSVKRYAGAGPEKFIYRARVLTGEYTVGSLGLLTPPPINTDNEEITYDSVVDKMTGTDEWAIFNDYKNYPEYLIKFQ